MPTALSNPDQATKDAILGPLVDTHLNGHLGTDLEDFAVALFGATATEARIAEGKEERKTGFPANDAATTEVCRSLIRAHNELQKRGEVENAKELRGIGDEHFGKDMVDFEIGNILMGR